MTISYDWLCRYLPTDKVSVQQAISPEKLSLILTSIGLEVECLEKRENIRGGLEGLVVGEVLSCENHPNADKLKVTTVNIGLENPLQIVCGAANVATGQKVIVAPIGIMVHPVAGNDFQIKKAKIRGVESQGMICAEDEVGLGTSHEGIKILKASLAPGTPLKQVFEVKTNYIFEIGLTPNRTDAMSHLGVARDVCAYLSYHLGEEILPVSPLKNQGIHNGNQQTISIQNNFPDGCRRFCAILIQNIEVKESPLWIRENLTAIGVNSINNIVDITNYILHETGQPLHAYDADMVLGNQLLVRPATDGEPFITLDGKERKLSAGDIVIADAEKPLCLAGVYGGLKSGVTGTTKNIILESAWFNPVNIRRTSLKQNLRTDAATRFEKGVDIGITDHVLTRAAALIAGSCRGAAVGLPIDLFTQKPAPVIVTLLFSYLEKLSGKNYSPQSVIKILTNLGFTLVEMEDDKLVVEVPTSKSDIRLPADLVEEIMRIDGLDNIQIPKGIFITPAIDHLATPLACAEKAANLLIGMGFYETFTNSISNSAIYSETEQAASVRMLNSLSSELDMMRPQMLQSALQVIQHNQNHRNTNIRCFEFGKTYRNEKEGITENKKLAIYISGNNSEAGWRTKPKPADFFQLKSVIEILLSSLYSGSIHFEALEMEHYSNAALIKIKKQVVGFLGETGPSTLKSFDLKQPVFYAEINWDTMLPIITKQQVTYREIPKYPAVTRDLSLVLDRKVSYGDLRDTVNLLNLPEIKRVSLFDLFESDKLGENKKAMALSFTLLDENKTMTDAETDLLMNKLIGAFETRNGAIIRK